MTITKELLVKEIKHQMKLYNDLHDECYALALDHLGEAQMVYANYRNNYQGEVLVGLEELETIY